MRIGLVRHFPVKKAFLRGRVKQSDVLQWFAEYNAAPLEPMEAFPLRSWKRCYSSQLSRATETARALFDGEIISTEALNEPFPSPIFKRDVKLPFLLWAMLIRLAILRNHPSQADTKGAVQARVRAWLEPLLADEEDLLIVNHAFTMEILSELLLENGFKGKRLSRPKNGVLYVYER